MSGLCFGMHNFVSFLRFAIILMKKKEVVYLVSCDCQCSVALPGGAIVVWSALCDFGTS